MIENLNAIVGFVFSTFSDFFALYIGGGILSGFFVSMHIVFYLSLYSSISVLSLPGVSC